MVQPLRALLIDDSADDARLLLRELERGGYRPAHERVATVAALEQALAAREWDIVFADYATQGIDALAALQLVRQRAPDVPVIIVWAPASEDAAVEAVRAGAADYLVHGQLARLLPAVERELRAGQERRARRQLEEEQRQAQKMEAVGRLAGGLAHDFNNLLTVINGYGDILLAQLPAGERPRCLVAEIRKAGERAAALTRQLMAISRRQPLAPTLLDLNTVITAMTPGLRQALGTGIELAAVLQPNLGRVRADPVKVEQVVLNLAANARDAMPQGGTLTLQTRDVEFQPCRAVADGAGSAHPQADTGPSPHVLLAVTDTGCGMAAEVQARCFEPFFTTKGMGKGTGLSLAVVYGIVQQSGGHIAVDSAPGAGTTFRIYLPRPEVPAGSVPPENVAGPGGLLAVGRPSGASV
jgi:signal transduction histidine kinase